MQNYTEINKCRVCGHHDLSEVLDLNEQPLANSYHRGDEQEKFPLKINTCNQCHHVQLSVVVNPDLMFKDYIYVSGTTVTLHEYFEYFVSLCESYGTTTGKVLDIACNDGTQLDKFKSAGWETYGVDPAENLYEKSSKNHKTICGYWDEKTAQSFQETFDLITAQNVFAHVHDVHSFLSACNSVVSKDGLVFIQTSQADMILDNQFDTVYHEHLSFFNTKSMKICANMNGFSLIDVKRVSVHGGSYVFVMRKGEHDQILSEQEILKESENGVYNIELYHKYSSNCKRVVSDFVSKVRDFSSKGYKVIGYGAAAKGNTFLNFANIKLEYIVDDNPLKQGLITPGMNIPIVGCDELKGEDHSKVVVVPLAWNFFDEIRKRANEASGSRLTYIKYFPNLEVVS